MPTTQRRNETLENLLSRATKAERVADAFKSFQELCHREGVELGGDSLTVCGIGGRLQEAARRARNAYADELAIANGEPESEVRERRSREESERWGSYPRMPGD